MIIKDFALSIRTCLSGLSFSFDELIMETQTLFEKEGVPGFLKVLIALIDNMVIEDWQSKENVDCCDSAKLLRAGKRSKKIYTSLGLIDFEWSRLRCKNCGKIYDPLKDFFYLETNQTKSSEFEKICLETVAKESYRRSVQTIRTHGTVDFNHRTLHRWVMNTDADTIKVCHDDLNVLLADGTKFKKFVSQKKQNRKNKLLEKLDLPPEEISKRGEVKILMGIRDDNSIVPLGAWTSDAWKTIGNFVHRANNPNKKLAPKKLANMLVSDGEIPLWKGLQKLTHHRQRCLWHVPHELRPLMKYQDKAPEEDVKYALEEVHSIFQIEIPEKDFDEVRIEEFVEMNEKIKKCEEQMKELSLFLSSKGHSQAATYVANAKDHLFTYLRYWMKTGVITPKVTSKLERLMREINRRIKKFAFNWSEKGCSIITRIIIKLICSPKEWENYWFERMKLNGNIRLTFGGIS